MGDTYIPNAERVFNFTNTFVFPIIKYALCIENYTGADYVPFYNNFINCYQGYVICEDDSVCAKELETAFNDFKNIMRESCIKLADSGGGYTELKNVYEDPVKYIYSHRINEENCF